MFLEEFLWKSDLRHPRLILRPYFRSLHFLFFCEVPDLNCFRNSIRRVLLPPWESFYGLQQLCIPSDFFWNCELIAPSNRSSPKCHTVSPPIGMLTLVARGVSSTSCV